MRKQIRLFYKAALLLCSFFFLQPIWGQIVNIEDKRKSFDSIGWYGRLDLGGNLTQNNEAILALTGSVRIDRFGENARNLIILNYNFIRAGEERFINDGFGHLRHSQEINEQWQWEAFGQLQYNRKLSIQLRGLTGTGPRFRFTDEADKWDVVVGVAYMYEYNELNEGLVIRRDHRLSSYLSWQVQLNSSVSFASTSYYQPLLNNFSESRLSSANTLVINVNKSIAFTSSFNVTYDNLLARLTEGIPQTSYFWRNGLRVMF